MNRAMLVIVGLLVLAGIIVAIGNRDNGSSSDRPGSQSGSSEYLDEYGGSSAIYSRLARATDCDELQAEFDQAAANNDRAEPGTDAHRWSLGYMVAAEDRMQAIGC